MPVFLGRHAGIFFPTGGAVPGESVHAGPGFHNSVDDARHLMDIRPAHRGHHHRADVRPVDGVDFLQRSTVTAGLPEPVMSLLQPVDGKLIFLTAQHFHPLAVFVRQVEGVAHDGEGNPFDRQQLQQRPEIRVQDGVAAGNIEIRHTAIHFTEVLAVGHHFLHLLPGHAVKLLVSILRKDIAMLAALVTVIGNMPLKSEILFHAGCLT